jgi:hypothetical protein
VIEPVFYEGIVWCIRVPSGAFIARRNGKVFVTGNSGFPKSLDVSKAIDKAAGAEREVIGKSKRHGGGSSDKFAQDEWTRRNMATTGMDLTAPATEAARQWHGFGTALKPAWESIVLARKPLDGTVAANVTRHGTGALNIDGCRTPGIKALLHDVNSDERNNPILHTRSRSGSGEMTSEGRWPTNMVFTHHCDCKIIGTKRVRLGKRDDGIGCRPGGFAGVGADSGSNRPNGRLYADADGMETVESWQCVDGCPVRALDEQAGERRSTGNYPSNSTNELNSNVYSKGLGGQGPIYSDSGGASRFYPTFAWEADDFIPYLYCPKASKKDRGEGNTHETVKPNQLMRWLARLVCPPGGVVFDPFMGSGSTGKAAIREGFGFLGIDDRPGNIPLARRRIDDAGP